ncbi:MAG: STAS domain-containing protein [Crocosphaera sp.]|nr:STAS domain-containing protein [Crocosphaera sp.]
MMGSHLINLRIAVFEPTGYITAANIDDFQEKLTNFVSNNSSIDFLVDMHQVEFIDSAGLMAIVSAFRLAQRLNKKLSVCSLSPSVRIIFELTQLDRALEIYESRQTYEASVTETVAA